MSKAKRKAEAAEKDRIKEFKELNLAPGTVVKIPIIHVRPNPHQPRRFFDENEIRILAESFEDGDVDCPIHVAVRGDHTLIIDGERRFRAALRAGLKEVSCYLFKDMADKEIFLRSARGNFGRENMSPVEVARALRKIMDDYRWSQAQAAQWASMHPTQVSQLMKYLNLLPEIQNLLMREEIPNGIALIVAYYPQENQLGLLKRLLDERNKLGGKIDQNTAIRIAKMEAEQQGLRPIRAKRGRQETLCHADAVIKNVMAKAAALERSLGEVASAEKAAGGPQKFFRGLKKTNILDAEAVLKIVKKKLDHCLQIISGNA